jgi:ATP synthase protein I
VVDLVGIVVFEGRLAGHIMIRLYMFQLTLIGITALGFYLYLGMPAAVAAAYGGLIALLNMLLLSWRAWRVEQGEMDAQQSLRHLYLSALERFAIVAVMFALGMGPLELQPVPVLISFMVGMVVLFSFGKSKCD